MGGMMLPDLGFDEAGFRREVFVVLSKGTANMIRNASCANAFTLAYDNMDKELAMLVETHKAPENAVREMKQHTKMVVESVVISSGVDLTSLHMEAVRKTCAHILSGIKSGNLLRLDKAYDDSVELFVKNGTFTYGEARELIAELSLLESRNFKDLLEKVGRSKKPGYLKFLQLVEGQGGERAKRLAALAKENLLSVQSKPPAKLPNPSEWLGANP